MGDRGRGIRIAGEAFAEAIKRRRILREQQEFSDSVQEEMARLFSDPNATDEDFRKFRTRLATSPRLQPGQLNALEDVIADGRRKQKFSQISKIVSDQTGLPLEVVQSSEDLVELGRIVNLLPNYQLKVMKDVAGPDGTPVVQVGLFNPKTGELELTRTFDQAGRSLDASVTIPTPEGPVQIDVREGTAAADEKQQIRDLRERQAKATKLKNLGIQVVAQIGASLLDAPPETVGGPTASAISLLESATTQIANLARRAGVSLPEPTEEQNSILEDIAAGDARRKAGLITLVKVLHAFQNPESSRQISERQMNLLVKQVTPLATAGSPLQARQAAKRLLEDVYRQVNLNLEAAELPGMTMEELQSRAPEAFESGLFSVEKPVRRGRIVDEEEAGELRKKGKKFILLDEAEEAIKDQEKEEEEQ